MHGGNKSPRNNYVVVVRAEAPDIVRTSPVYLLAEGQVRPMIGSLRYSSAAQY